MESPDQTPPPPPGPWTDPWQGQAPGPLGYPAPYAPFGPPPMPPARPATNGFALAALITGIVSILGTPTSLGTLGIIGGIVGIALGVVGVRRFKRGGPGGKGLAVSGIVVSAIAVAAGAVMVVQLGPRFVEGFTRGVEDGIAAGQPTDQPADPPADPVPDEPSDGTTDVPAIRMNPDGEWEDMPKLALQLGQDAIIGDYKVTVIAIELDADAAIAAASPRNAPPYGQYVMATLSVTYRGTSEGKPLDDLIVSYPAADNYVYDETTCAAVTARPVAAVGTLALDETAEFDVCLDVYPEAIDRPRVLVHDLTTESWEAKLWSAE